MNPIIFLALRDKGLFKDAEACGRVILHNDPKNHLMWFEYGKVLLNLDRYDDACQAFREALSICPASIGYALFLGHSLLSLRGIIKSSTRGYCSDTAFYRKNISDHIIELFNVSCDLIQSSCFDEAEICCRIVILCNSDQMLHTYYTLASLLLLRGSFREPTSLLAAWYEKSAVFNKQSLRFWRGESLEGKTLWVFNEHGLGDTIQFARFLRIVAPKCGRVMLTLPAPLWKIIGDIPNVEKCLGVPERYDVTCSLFMLPHLVGIDLATVGGSVPYLSVEPERVAFWKERLPREGFRIGIAWQGNPNYVLEPARSIPLACYAPLARLPNVRLISLQMNHGLDQLERLPDGMEVTTLGPGFNAGPDNVVDTAAVMKNLDLIISSDTSVPHIAGALGCPVWSLLTSIPDWRWLLEREDCPWYPTMRLFRQKRRGDWTEVIERVAEELARLIEGPRP